MLQKPTCRKSKLQSSNLVFLQEEEEYRRCKYLTDAINEIPKEEPRRADKKLLPLRSV